MCLTVGLPLLAGAASNVPLRASGTLAGFGQSRRKKLQTVALLLPLSLVAASLLPSELLPPLRLTSMRALPDLEQKLPTLYLHCAGPEMWCWAVAVLRLWLPLFEFVEVWPPPASMLLCDSLWLRESAGEALELIDEKQMLSAWPRLLEL